MTTDEMRTKYLALPDGVEQVVDILFELFEALNKSSNTITIAGLADAFDLAIEDGCEMASIQLAMISYALSISHERREALR